VKKKSVILITLLLLFATGLISKNFKAYYTKERPIIDGKFDPVYEKFLKIDKFYQIEKKWGYPISEKTVAYIGFDDKNFYFAIKCYDSKPSRIRATLSKRDKFENNDMVIFFLDTFQTKRKSLVFGFNPLGIQLDGIRDDENYKSNMDFAWDTLWYSIGKIYDWGYFVEARIPFRSLRFRSNRNVQEWGFVIGRIIAGKGETAVSFNFDRKKRGVLSQADTLILNKRLISGRNMEIIPTFTGLKNKGDKINPEFGLSFKYGITSNSTIDFTINPDFSHIEADEGMIDINQRYALYYSEKRPFFLEAKEMFEMPMNLFYSRRIVSPQWGVKFTGRFGKFGIGLISAKDTSSFEDIRNVSEGGEDEAFVNIVRLKYEIMDSSHIGLFFSSKNWNDKDNYVLSTDSFLKFGNFGLRMMGSFSKTVDKNGNILFGEFSYSKNDIFFGAGYFQISPEFDSQIGFIKKQSYRRLYFYSGYSFYPNLKEIKSIRPSIFIMKDFDWQTGNMIESSNTLKLNVKAFNNTFFNFIFRKGMENYKNNDFDKLGFGGGVFSDINKYVSFSVFFMLGDSINYDPNNPYLGYAFFGRFSLNLNLFNRSLLQLSYKDYFFYKDAGGELQYKMNIFRLRNIFMFSREISSRLIYEFNDYYESHFLSFLLSYELNPATVVYLGVSGTFYKKDQEIKNENYSIFFKLSYLLRI